MLDWREQAGEISWSIAQGYKRTPPRQPTQDQLDFLASKPIADVGIEFYATAYAVLSSCRSIGMAIGPIWQTAIDEYSDRHGHDDEVRAAFGSVIRLVDQETVRRSHSSAKVAAAHAAHRTQPPGKR